MVGAHYLDKLGDCVRPLHHNGKPSPRVVLCIGSDHWLRGYLRLGGGEHVSVANTARLNVRRSHALPVSKSRVSRASHVHGPRAGPGSPLLCRGAAMATVREDTRLPTANSRNDDVASRIS